jgi:glycosyltransferase involved in cell wall biosynthesis
MRLGGAALWNHVSQPLTSDGSAVNIVIRELTRVAFDGGVRSTVAAAANRDVGFPRAELLPVDFSQYLDHDHLLLRERVADTVSGWTGHDRKHVSRMYRPIGDALLGSEGPIIVHDGYLGAAGLETLHRMYPSRPLFLWMHQPLSPAYSAREVRRFLSLAERVICVSDWLRDSVRRAARSNSIDSRLATIVNGVDITRFRPTQGVEGDGVPSILFTGRMLRIKGPHVLAAALNDLHNEGIDFRATFVGVDHPDVSRGTRYQQALRRMTAPFSDKVTFVPFLPHSELPEVYRKHQIMVVPSKFQEPCCLSLLEGMASGLAVVVARRGGMPQVGEDSVQYFEQQDELTGALRDLLQDAHLRSHWAGLARARATHLTWTHVFDAAREFISPAVTA